MSFTEIMEMSGDGIEGHKILYIKAKNIEPDERSFYGRIMDIFKKMEEKE